MTQECADEHYPGAERLDGTEKVIEAPIEPTPAHCQPSWKAGVDKSDWYEWLGEVRKTREG
jgi:hypothetical protein